MKHFTENQLGKFLKGWFRCLSLKTQKGHGPWDFPWHRNPVGSGSGSLSPLLKLTCSRTPHSVFPKGSVPRGKVRVRKAGDRHCLQMLMTCLSLLSFTVQGTGEKNRGTVRVLWETIQVLQKWQWPYLSFWELCVLALTGTLRYFLCKTQSSWPHLTSELPRVPTVSTKTQHVLGCFSDCVSYENKQ